MLRPGRAGQRSLSRCTCFANAASRFSVSRLNIRSAMVGCMVCVVAVDRFMTYRRRPLGEERWFGFEFDGSQMRWLEGDVAGVKRVPAQEPARVTGGDLAYVGGTRPPHTPGAAACPTPAVCRNRGQGRRSARSLRALPATPRCGLSWMNRLREDRRHG